MHKDSIDIAVAEAPRDGELRHLGSVAGGVDAVGKSMRKLVNAGNKPLRWTRRPHRGSLMASSSR